MVYSLKCKEEAQKGCKRVDSAVFLYLSALLRGGWSVFVKPLHNSLIDGILLVKDV